MSTGLLAPGLGPELSLKTRVEIPFINVNSIYLLKAVTTVSVTEVPLKIQAVIL